ncbi:LEM domain-containing protein 1 isoform X3 [Mauremys reevesii]|uniref:LEM domain-containing protein 1 isoform X3 n=1 Tax=Mauremys reevesii TaxID=260615 RepID=UPI00193FEF63|nr:LEM domain-containing protein 1 isoform X3 [Mauremys reevesii]
MAQVTVGVLIEKQEQENQDQDTTDEISIKLLSDNELQEKLLMYGTEPGPILPSTRTLYENKLLQLVNPSPQGLRAKPKESGDLDQSSESEEEKETSTEVVLETKDFKVTAACATGYSKAPHTEFSERHKKLLAPDADYSLAKIVAEAADTMGDSVSKDDGQGETWLPEPRSPIGISPRRRSVRESDPSTQNIVEKSKVEKEKPKASALEHKEAHRGILSMPIRIAILAIFVFVLFVYVTMETNPDNPFTNFITGRG